MSTNNVSLASTEYQNFRDEITKRIRSAQYEALKAVNKEMIALLLGNRKVYCRTADNTRMGKICCGKPFQRYSKGISGN